MLNYNWSTLARSLNCMKLLAFDRKRVGRKRPGLVGALCFVVFFVSSWIAPRFFAQLTAASKASLSPNHGSLDDRQSLERARHELKAVIAQEPPCGSPRRMVGILLIFWADHCGSCLDCGFSTQSLGKDPNSVPHGKKDL